MSRPQIRVLLIQVNIRSLRPTCSISRLAQRFLSTSTRRLAPPTATSLKNETGDNVKLGALGTTASGKKLNIRTYPRYDDLEDERLYRKQHLAAAFRIFAERGFDEGVAGHIRLNPLSRHFSLIRVSDLILVNESGTVIHGDEPINAAAFAIHSAIHRARPNANAACHAHSVHGKAFSAFGRHLDMITQDSLRFYNHHGVYKHFGGVVLDEGEGDRIAECLGDGKAVILQNHGLLTVGESVDEAAFWFMSLDRTCHAQLLVDAAAGKNGNEKKIINEEEARYSFDQVGTPEKGWLAFQSYYDALLDKTKGDFLH
ncbi:hypothetical protein EG327_006115 [Venturia inaequalis]|uniref:Class II aldolase/adducin N-terminal domain-containing protein n=1 Tax=Venturia inaequalis TaxID=5025 RepID=A0A8H3Z1F3_VENIN|nr:hypothetical protein EG327_006115 [Venturia inaequalis]